MNRFSRVRHHVSVEDVKKKHLEKIAVENFIKTEEEISKTISEKFKRNWRRELEEGMTTANTLSTILPAEGDTAIDQLSPVDAASFADVNNMFGSGADNPALDGATIRANGSGSGDNGGFNVGGEYLAFQGTGSGGSRMALLSPMDATKVDTLTITAIRGNSSNGGEEADIVGQEELFIIYKTPEMSRSSYLSQDRSQNNIGSFPADAAIIAIGQGDGTLQDYTITIPEYARQKDTVFGLFQLSHSGTGYDHYGVTDIKFQRKTPLNVVVSLDSPEAISFVRVGTDEGDPKKRKKKVNDQLKASDEYTTKQMGGQFPGQGARLGDEASSAGAPDPFSSASIQEPEASPIGKDAITKAFAKFSAQAASAEPEVEPEVPITPSAQATMQPKTEDGEEIEVKPVGKIAVQGADAAKLEAEMETETEVEPEIEPTSVDEPELDPEDDEEGLSSEEKNEKLNAAADKGANIIDKLIDFRLDQGLKSFNAIAQVTGVVLNTAFNIGGFAANILGMKEANGFVSMIGKIQNSIDIARSVLSGKITNANVLPQEIKSFTDSMKLDEFQANKINISDVRHEYADDNIYVKDGKVYQNGDGKLEKGLYATPLANQGFETLDTHGSGYAQMIIPKDGSEPYLHYYDHNYENLNNAGDVNPTGGIVQSIDEIWSSLFGPEDLVTSDGKVHKGLGKANPVDIVAAGFKSISHVIHQLKSGNTKFLPTRLKDSMLTYFGSFDQVYEGLLNTSIEGFPPGIHGSALTDFKVPLDKLPEETQKMIANHPLSWTPERVANMSEDDFVTQFQNRSTDKFSADWDSNNFKNFDAYLLKALEDPDSGVDPEFLKNFKRFVPVEYDQKTRKHIGAEKGTVQYDYDIAVEELQKVQDTPEYSAASDAAIKVWEDTRAEEKEKIKENNETYGASAQLKLWEKLVGPYYRAVQRATSGGSMSSSHPTYQNMVNGKKEYDKQAKVMERKYAQERDAISDKYKKLADEAYAKYEDTVQVRKLDDGTYGMVNGGDFKTKSGKVIPGMRTLSAKQQARFEEVREEYDQLQEYLETADYTSNMVKPYVLYDVKTEFAKTGLSGENWIPPKKGSGHIEGGYSSDGAKSNQSFGGSRSSYAGTGADASFTIDPIVPLGAKSGDQLAGIGGVVGGITAVAAFLGMAADAARTWWKNASPEQRQKIKDLINNRQNAHYVPMGNPLLEKYANPNGKISLYEKLKTRGFFNPKDIKPTFPENDPPEIDKKTGMHPNYGKQAKRYKKLDPMSANAMPSTGDPEIDAVVDQQRTKKKPAERKKEYIKTVSKIKKMAKGGLTKL